MTNRFLLGIVALCILLSTTIGFIALLLNLTERELRLLTLYLLVSGIVTVFLAVASIKLGLPGRIGTIRGRLILVCILATLLSLGSIGFIARLMFLSTHDLGLLAALLVFSLGLSVFVAIAFSEVVVRNLNKLLVGVRRLSSGDLSAQVIAESEDEIGGLMIAFNEMAQQLKSSFQRERELEQTRRDLITAVSHDLRTPLSSIRAMIESINDRVVDDEETIHRYHRTIQSEVEDLSHLVADLFEISQIDAGTLQLHIDEYAIQELISDIVEMMAPEAALRQLALKGEVSHEIPPVAVDAHKIQRVLYNLVQNAIRHTPPDGSISILAEDVGVEVRVQVSDTGEGISADDLGGLFDKSDSAIHSPSAKKGGTGLGLRIAKGLVEAHGGRIWAESKPGSGSAFSFTLPKASSSLGT